MQYARLGETGLIVSRLALGSMTFGAGAGIFASVAKVDQKGANDLVARAIHGGINFFNSADVYAGGESERILGKAIGPNRRDVVIATKLGNRMSAALIDSGLSRQHVFAAADASLERLGTDYIDVYLVHKVDPLTPIEETIEALEDLVRAGQGALRRLLELVRVAGGESRRHPAGARLDAVPRGRDVLLARRPRSRARRCAVLRGRRHRRDGLEPPRGRIPERQVHAREAEGRERRPARRLRLPAVRPRARLRSDRSLAVDRREARRDPCAGVTGLAADAPDRSSILVGASSAKQLEDELAARGRQARRPTIWRRSMRRQSSLSHIPNWFTDRVADGKAHAALGIKLAVPPIR